MKLTDGKKTISITMRCWDGSRFMPDISDDFFESGGLSRIWVESVNEEVCKVPDVDYCIEQAEDWASYRGDYFDPDAKEEDQKCGIERSIYVEKV